jgi:hypothetical protein
MNGLPVATGMARDAEDIQDKPYPVFQLLGGYE